MTKEKVTPTIETGTGETWAVLLDVAVERDRQNAKWGEQNHTEPRWLAILMEEVGEAAKALLENRGDDYSKELVQVAAVAVAAIECRARLRLPGVSKEGK